MFLVNRCVCVFILMSYYVSISLRVRRVVMVISVAVSCGMWVRSCF